MSVPLSLIGQQPEEFVAAAQRRQQQQQAAQREKAEEEDLSYQVPPTRRRQEVHIPESSINEAVYLSGYKPRPVSVQNGRVNEVVIIIFNGIHFKGRTSSSTKQH